MPKEQVPVWDEKAMENLKGCFDKEGRLLRCPSKPAKKLLVLVGTKKAVGYAVRNVTVTSRNTRLKERLQGE